eukprot:261690_1
MKHSLLRQRYVLLCDMDGNDVLCVDEPNNRGNDINTGLDFCIGDGKAGKSSISTPDNISTVFKSSSSSPDDSFVLICDILVGDDGNTFSNINELDDDINGISDDDILFGNKLCGDDGNTLSLFSNGIDDAIDANRNFKITII